MKLFWCPPAILMLAGGGTPARVPASPPPHPRAGGVSPVGHTHTHMLKHRQTGIDACMFTRAGARARTCTNTQLHTRTQASTCPYARARTQHTRKKYTRTCNDACTCANTRTGERARTLTYTNKHTRADARTLTCARAHTHTHRHTPRARTHAHAQARTQRWIRHLATCLPLKIKLQCPKLSFKT